ncbi:MAG: hypothetical protein V9G29_01585 [Burkholderiaceae bacterium]
MTAGDLTTTPKPWGRDEAAHLMFSLADMQVSLRKIVTQVRGASESIVHASTEIAAASIDLSQRTEASGRQSRRKRASVDGGDLVHRAVDCGPTPPKPPSSRRATRRSRTTAAR